MRVLVLGGTRFIGPQVVSQLVQQGHVVAVFHRGQTESPLPAGVERILGDRAKLVESKERLRSFRPEAVIDMYAMKESDAQGLVDVFRSAVDRVIVASSIDVYRARDRLWKAQPGPPDPVPLGEDAPLREGRFPYRALAKGPEDPHFEYDKIPVEQLVVGELAATVLRLPAVYGPNDHRHRVYEYLQPMMDRREVVLLDEGVAQWRLTRGFVTNVAHAIALAASSEHAAGRIYNVGEADAHTEAEWVESIASAAGWRGSVVRMPRGLLPPALAAEVASLDLAQDWVVDTRRIRDELGYRELVGWDEGLRDAVEWEIAHPPAPAPEKDYEAEDAALARMRAATLAG